MRIREHHRSQVICDAMAAGIRRCGHKVIELWEHDYDLLASPWCDLSHVVFYGLEGKMPLLFRDFANAFHRRAVYVDLGYWGRREGGRFTGFHKVSVNARHPTAYFRRPQHDRRRLSHFADLLAQPWNYHGHHILLAGMGDKGALAEGYKPEEWERQAIETIRANSRRPILYRAKPSWKKAQAIPGTVWSDSAKRPVELDLQNCWAVVTHHSNVAIDGLIAGIPAFCWDGLARDQSCQRLDKIDRPLYPDGRDAWMADIAYTQWRPDEMAAGACWQHLIGEGLV